MQRSLSLATDKAERILNILESQSKTIYDRSSLVAIQLPLAREPRMWCGVRVCCPFTMIVGIAVGYITTYIVVIGIPPAQSLIITGITYYVIMKVKAKVAPDKFTEGIN